MGKSARRILYTGVNILGISGCKGVENNKGGGGKYNKGRGRRIGPTDGTRSHESIEQTGGHSRWAGTIENVCPWKEKVKNSGFMDRTPYVPDPQLVL
jgi:hypothetical protein